MRYQSQEIFHTLQVDGALIDALLPALPALDSVRVWRDSMRDGCRVSKSAQ